MPLYQFVTLRHSTDEAGRQVLDSLTDLVWSPTDTLVAERAEIEAEKRFPGSRRLGTIANKVRVSKILKNGLGYAWLNLRLLF